MEISKSAELFNPSSEFRSKLPLSEEEFLHIANEAIAQVGQNNKGIFSKTDQPGGFNNEKAKELQTFAVFAYRLNSLMTQGKDRFLAAKLALAYRLGESVVDQDFKNVGLDKLTPEEYNELFSRNFDTTGVMGIRNLGTTLEVIGEDEMRSFYTRPPEIEEDSESLAEFLKDLESLEYRKTLAVVNFKRLITDIHAMRTACLRGHYIGLYSLQTTYLPLVLPLYILARHATHQELNGSVKNELDERELVTITFNITHSEIPPQDMVEIDPPVRVYWSRMAALVKDYLLHFYAPESFALADETLTQVAGTSYQQRTEIGSTLNFTSLYPNFTKELGSRANGQNLTTNRPNRGAPNDVLIARSYGFSSSEIAGELGVTRISANLVDFLIRDFHGEQLPEESTVKSAWSTLERAVQSPTILDQLRKYGKENGLLGHFKVDHDLFYIATLSRVMLLSKILKREQVSQIRLDITNAISNLNDIYRLRVYLPDGQLDHFLASEPSKDVRVLFEEQSEGQLPQVIWKTVPEIHPESVEQAINHWYKTRRQQGSYRIFSGLFISHGKNTEVQVIPLRHIQDAWFSRSTFKLETPR